MKRPTKTEWARANLNVQILLKGHKHTHTSTRCSSSWHHLDPVLMTFGGRNLWCNAVARPGQGSCFLLLLRCSPGFWLFEIVIEL